MSKTTTIKITTRTITTHLPFLDTTMTIKSYPFFGKTSIYFGEPRGDEAPHRERIEAAAEQRQNLRSLTPAEGVDDRSFRLDTDPLGALKHTGSSPGARCRSSDGIPVEWRGPSRSHGTLPSTSRLRDPGGCGARRRRPGDFGEGLN